MVEQFGQIFQDATTGTYNKETKYNMHNEQDSVVSALTQLTSFHQKERDDLEKEHVLPTIRHNIYLSKIFNPPEDSCKDARTPIGKLPRKRKKKGGKKVHNR